MYVLHIKLKIWKVNKNCPILVKTLSLYYCLYCNNWHSLFKMFKTGLIISHYPNMIFIFKISHFTNCFILQKKLASSKLYGIKNCNSNEEKLSSMHLIIVNWTSVQKIIILERVFILFYTDLLFQWKNGLCFKKYILTVISVPEFHRLDTFYGL